MIFNKLKCSAANAYPSAIEIVLPESVFLASFFNVFPTVPKAIRMLRSPTNATNVVHLL